MAHGIERVWLEALIIGAKPNMYQAAVSTRNSRSCVHKRRANTKHAEDDQRIRRRGRDGRVMVSRKADGWQPRSNQPVDLQHQVQVANGR